MRSVIAGFSVLVLTAFIGFPAFAQEKKNDKASAGAQEKKAEKKKAEKVVGDVGLLDLEKNYMIIVTKDGKLVTLDVDNKTKVTALEPTKAKISDVGLGSTASVQWTEKGDKKILTSIEFKAAKGGD